MGFKPLHDRVAVKRVGEEEKSAGGIIIPDTAQEKPQIGIVMAVGPGKSSDSGDLISMFLKKGDKVLYGKYSGTEIMVNGDDVLIMRESDILATL